MSDTTNFPASDDDTTSLPNPVATDTTISVPHAELHTAQNKAIIATQTKIGTGASTPTANKILMGDGTGTSSWTDAVPESSISGLTTDLASKANSSDLATVATSGSYTDLSDTPTIPSTFDDLTDGTTNKAFTSTLKTKLDGIASGAEVNVVDSVNTKTGDVVLDPDDLDDGTTSNKFVTSADITKLGNLSGTNTGDQTISDATISLTDVTTNNVSTTKHGFTPKLPNDSAKFLNGEGLWATPAGGGGSGNVASDTIWDEKGDLAVGTGADTAAVLAPGSDDELLVADSAETTGLKWTADITPTTVNGVTLSGSSTPTLAVTGTTTVSGDNTGDQTTITGNAGTATKLATARTIGGVSFDGSANITLPGVNTTGTQNTSGSAATLTTARAINGINFDGSSAVNVPGVKWAVVTTTTQTAAINSGYIANNASLVTITLPTTYAIGSTVRVVGLGAGGWKIAQPAGDNIVFGTSTTTTGTGGSLASTNQYDAVELVAIVANTTWAVVSSVGNITVV